MPSLLTTRSSLPTRPPPAPPAPSLRPSCPFPVFATAPARRRLVDLVRHPPARALVRTHATLVAAAGSVDPTLAPSACEQQGVARPDARPAPCDGDPSVHGSHDKSPQSAISAMPVVDHGRRPATWSSISMWWTRRPTSLPSRSTWLISGRATVLATETAEPSAAGRRPIGDLGQHGPD